MEEPTVNWTFQLGMLPRAGSAWLATLLNMHEGVFCYHDALQSFDGKYRLAAAAKKEYEHIGDASSFCCTQPHLKRSVFVNRDPDEVLADLEKHNMSEGFDEILRVCTKWSMGTKVFRFRDIFSQYSEASIKVLREMFEILVPGVPLNPDKARMLLPLKVELLYIGPDMFDLDKITWRIN